MKHRIAIASLASLCAAVPTAFAADSVYTPLDLPACTQRPTDTRAELPWTAWDCEGFGGITVMVAESDLRFNIGYGIDGPADLGAGQTLPPFNTIGDTLEWRIDEAGTPFATILRYFVDPGDPAAQGEVLVVTRVGSPSCQVAYVDALANEDANALARAAADLIAPNFRCDVDMPLWVSATGPLF